MARGRGQGAGRRPRRGRGRVTPSSPAPFDAIALRESASLTGEGADERARLAAAYQKAQRQLGLGGDSADPYGASAENKRELTNAERGIGTRAGNSLYSGATLNAGRAARSAYDTTQKRLEAEFGEAQDQYTGGVAQTTRDEALGQAGIKGEAIERAASAAPAPLAVGGGRKRGRGRVVPGSNVNGRRGRGRV